MDEPTTEELVEFLDGCADDVCGMEVEDRHIIKQAAHKMKALERAFRRVEYIVRTEKMFQYDEWVVRTDAIKEAIGEDKKINP
jgi:hypothetical protein